MALRSTARRALVFALVAIVFLPSLTLSISAYTPSTQTPDRDYFLLYQGDDGDAVCRQANALEQAELETITPRDLRQINHLDKLKSGVSAESDNALPAHLTIILRGTARLNANAAATAAFNRAAAAWENLVSSPVTIYVDVDFGPDNFGQAWPKGILGSTSSPSLSSVNYTLLRNTLLSGANTPAKQGVYNALPQNSIPTDSGNLTSVSVSASIARAIGLLDPTAQPGDLAAQIGFNSELVTYDFDPSDGLVGTDFEAVATHELGHALGFTSRAGATTPRPAMWDLYRFRSGTTAASFTAAQRILTIGGPTSNSQYFFMPGITELGLSDGGPDGATDNNADGNQSSHWREASKNNFVYIGIMDPRIPSRTRRQITENDINVLNIFGYNSTLVTPPSNSNSTIQFSQSSYSVGEGGNALNIGVTRTGDTSGAATINYATSDVAGLTSCMVVNGNASERCDYGTTAGTVRFAAGETSKSFIIPIVNDALVEGNETFSLRLTGPTGSSLGALQTATVTIVDNDGAPGAQNPIDGVNFFVTQQYIDFLGRLPDSTGLANWVATLGNCPNGGFGEFDNPGCDRVHVSAGFFLSPEFQGRGYFAYRFYEVALNRRPAYAEFVPDMAQVGGPQSPESEVLSKAAYTDAWMQRAEFRSRYDGLSNAAYVNTLEANAEVSVFNKATLIAALDGGTMNRGQVLRDIVENPAVANQFFNRAFVAMQYFGYLRRDPDAVGFQNWLTTLNNNPADFRHMIFGFLFSTEYRQRFGP